MTPVLQAQEFYGAEFPRVLSAHFMHGHVSSGPDHFVMFRAVDSSAPSDTWLDFWTPFDPATCDAWFITYYAGDLKAILKVEPRRLPKVIFQRDCGEFRVYYTKSILPKIHGKQAQSPTADEESA